MPKLKDFLASYLSIFISIVSSLLMLPLYIAYFGVEDYGAWIVINTFIQYLAIANFGLPTSFTIIASNLRNKAAISPLFYRCFKMLILIVTVVILCFVLGVVSNLIYPEIFFGRTSKSSYYFFSLIYAFCLYCLRSPIQLASCIFLSTGKVYVNKVYEILNNLTIPISFVAIYFFKGEIMTYIVLSGLLMLLIAVTSFLHAIVVFKKENKLISDANELLTELPTKKEILKLSLGYFVTSIGAALVWNTDNLVISHYLPLADVTKYSITFRIYSTAFLIFNTYNGVLMPFYGIYRSQNRVDLMSLSFKKSLFFSTTLASIIWFLTYIFSKDIIEFWTRDEALYAGKYLFLILGGYGFILSMLSTVSVFFSSLKLVKIMVFVTFLEGFTNLIISILLVRNYGLMGIAIGTVSGAAIGLLVICYKFDDLVEHILKLPKKVMISNLVVVLVILAMIWFFDLDIATFQSKLFWALILSVSFIMLTFKINGYGWKDLNLKSNGNI